MERDPSGVDRAVESSPDRRGARTAGELVRSVPRSRVTGAASPQTKTADHPTVASGSPRRFAPLDGAPWRI